MEKSEQFSDYLFAKMGPPHTTTVNGSELPPKTTERCEAPRELKGYRKWLSENLMLLVTLSGVMLGVILGKSLLFFAFYFLLCYVLITFYMYSMYAILFLRPSNYLFFLLLLFIQVLFCLVY